jgi:hypothetical protein
MAECGLEVTHSLKHILQALHDSGIGGHSGTLATYQRVKKIYLAKPEARCARVCAEV